MGHVLVYYDGGDLSEKCLKRALEMYDPEKDELILVMVIPSARIGERDTVPDITVAEARAFVDATLERLEREGIHAIGIVHEGDVAQELANIANSMNVKSLVIPDEPNKKVGRFMVGNLAEMVLKVSSRPVLVVK